MSKVYVAAHEIAYDQGSIIGAYETLAGAKHACVFHASERGETITGWKDSGWDRNTLFATGPECTDYDWAIYELVVQL